MIAAQRVPLTPADEINLRMGIRDIVMLDAYTYSPFWTTVSWTENPSVVSRGSLRLLWVPKDGDRDTIRGEYRYGSPKNREWVRIEVSPDQALAHYEVGENMLVGLCGHTLTDIVMLHLHEEC